MTHNLVELTAANFNKLSDDEQHKVSEWITRLIHSDCPSLVSSGVLPNIQSNLEVFQREKNDPKYLWIGVIWFQCQKGMATNFKECPDNCKMLEKMKVSNSKPRIDIFDENII